MALISFPVTDRVVTAWVFHYPIGISAPVQSPRVSWRVQSTVLPKMWASDSGFSTRGHGVYVVCIHVTARISFFAASRRSQGAF